jgi:hypothetical protein
MEFFSFIFVAMAVETIVNIINTIKEKEKCWKYWASLGAALFLAPLVSYNWDIDLFKLVGLPEGKIPLLGPILTGLIASRGSNVTSDLIDKLNAWRGE